MLIQRLPRESVRENEFSHGPTINGFFQVEFRPDYTKNKVSEVYDNRINLFQLLDREK